MRILLVVHRFLPRHAAGTEVYTHQIAVGLRARGHDVRVVCGEKEISRVDLSVTERQVDGIPVSEVTNNLYYDDFQQTWRLPKFDRFLAQRVERDGVDVVHFQHVLHLSAGAVEAVAKVGPPVLFTLHDYWLQCPRLGQLVHADGSICHTVEFERCGGCLARTKWGQSSTEQRVGRRLAALRASTGLDLGPAAVASASFVRGREPRRSGPTSAATSSALTEGVRERDAYLREHLVPHVDHFLSPSRFLLERFVEWGIPRARIDHHPIGMDLERFRPQPKTKSEKVRVAFLGTLHPSKGVHVLLAAWGRLPSELRARAQLTIYGPDRHYPDYVHSLRESARTVGARLGGRVERADVPSVLASVDLIVVPSLWYENSPLALLEARATRTPALASALGGMAELVLDGITGATFAVGDEEDLAQKLAELIGEPARLQRFFGAAPPVRTVDDDLDDLEALYERFARERSDSGSTGQAPR